MVRGMRAAILTAHGQPFEFRDDVEVAAPGPGEVRVRLAASGVCGSDLAQWASEDTPIPSQCSATRPLVSLSG